MKDWWLKLSIRYKILQLTSFILICSSILSFFSVTMLERYLADFDFVLGDSYQVNQVLGQFEQEQNAFRQYANHRQEDEKEIYLNIKKQTGLSISNLRYNYKEMGLERYLLTQTIQTAYRSYSQYCESTLFLEVENDYFITSFYKAAKVATYMDSYIRDLMKETLTEGNAMYYQRVKAYQMLPPIVFFLVILVIAMSFFIWRLTSRHVLKPVLVLADSARRITANELDLPDVMVENQDEIGELAYAFNNMRRAMSDFITSLHEKREIETLLHKEELQRINAEASMQKLQISLLQSQINPHFLFNTLNTISNMAKFEEASNTKELILRLSNLFRYNLQTTNEMVSLTRELQIIKDYMYIQYRRFGQRLQLEVDCRLDSDLVKIPTFTLQPIVENAVIHGISPREEGGLIRIRIYERNKNVIIVVADNGFGISQETLSGLAAAQSNTKGHVSGIGIGNVKERLETLCAGSKLQIFSSIGRGTVVRLKVPVPSVEDAAQSKETGG